ncbi:MAG TPA: cytochrome c maturation protein CcmE [Candidatus Kapabacteria bacterium]|nr:cytochrome c maturation protein CcmE [Candidatus Kapabacteria bacterium]
MKIKYILGLAIGVVFVAIAIMSFDSSKIEYTDFIKAKNTGKIVQVIGSWDRSLPVDVNTDKNIFKFSMVDEQGNKSVVLAKGGKPNNFDVAPMLVIKGRYEGNDFHASEILTKCPSKYEGQFEDLQGTSLYNEKK